MGLPEAVTANYLKERIRAHVRYTLAREWGDLEPSQLFLALAYTIRDYLTEVALENERRIQTTAAKRVCYLSIEYLIGRLLANNLRNLGLYDLCRKTLREMGVDLDELLEREPDAALGNGGLGRLAACFLDSLATLGYAATGYGLNYEHGLFRQEIVNGQQVERPENWRSFGSPWLIPRPEEAVPVPLYGRVEHRHSPDGRYRPVWTGFNLVLGVPSDLPIVGYGGDAVSYLRLYSAHSYTNLDLAVFERGAYLQAVERRIADETISRVLYPSDAMEAGRELRLRQEYFFSACAVRDIVRRHEAEHHDVTLLPDKVAIQLNDTHPALAISELMRLLMDDRELGWDEAWDITRRTFGYTNHTLMPEALETWPVSLLEKIAPRHMHIIYEINRRLGEEARQRWPENVAKVERCAIIQRHPEQRVNMAGLAVAGSHSTNGVSRVHSELVKTRLFPDYADLWPERFNNKTNGVTQRRWILNANPRLARLISELVGPAWVTDMERVKDLESYRDDGAVLDSLAAIKLENKARLARFIASAVGEYVDTQSLFDVHVKRIHEYKRQLLNALRVGYEYLRIVDDGYDPPVPRTFVFAGKAAVGYFNAKQTIRVVLELARLINRDAKARKYLRVVFLPDYRVTLAERIIPAADLSEQISTAGTEASGTGNMKLAMNGALTIATRDGANVEMAEAIGEEHMFLFGLGVDEAMTMRQTGRHNPSALVEADTTLQRVLAAFGSGRLSPRHRDVGEWVYRRLVADGDEFLVLADFHSYLEAQERVCERYQNKNEWNQSCLLTIARMSRFSTDRTVREYAREIWGVEPCF